MPLLPKRLTERIVAAIILATSSGVQACTPEEVATPAVLQPDRVTALSAAPTVNAAGIATIATPTSTSIAAAVPSDRPAATPTPARPTITLSAIRVASTGSAEAVITLSGNGSGLSGFSLTIQVADGSLATISQVTLPDYGLATISAVPNVRVRVSVADINNKVMSGGGAVVIATLRLQGLKQGSTRLPLSDIALDDEKGNALIVQVMSGDVTVF